MFLKDIPIELINLALVAIIATPFVLAWCIVSAVTRIVRPLWAMRDQLARIVEAEQSHNSIETVHVKREPSLTRRIANSMFGR
jgi:hypothetical protein